MSVVEISGDMQGAPKLDVLSLLQKCADVYQNRSDFYPSICEMYDAASKLENTYFWGGRTPKDIAMQHVLNKLNRIRYCDSGTKTFDDSFVDAIVYLAIAWELSQVEIPDADKTGDVF